MVGAQILPSAVSAGEVIRITISRAFLPWQVRPELGSHDHITWRHQPHQHHPCCVHFIQTKSLSCLTFINHPLYYILIQLPLLIGLCCKPHPPVGITPPLQTVPPGVNGKPYQPYYDIVVGQVIIFFLVIFAKVLFWGRRMERMWDNQIDEVDGQTSLRSSYYLSGSWREMSHEPFIRQRAPHLSNSEHLFCCERMSCSELLSAVGDECLAWWYGVKCRNPEL